MAGLYIHIPYCHSKCHYCDFYSGSGLGNQDAYVSSIVREFQLRKSEVDEPYNTIYIGGGTPSSLEVANLQSLLSFCVTDIIGDIEEFTIEVNPEDVTASLIELLKQHGVNRVSMGIQSLVADELTVVGRNHTPERALESAGLIADSFSNFSFDLIFGLPGQTIDSLTFSLEKLLEFRPPHISVYLLSYEPGTRLYARLVAGKIKETDDAIVTGMYNLVSERLRNAGYVHYEISNYALPGFESRHNSSYWASVPYLGLGASAHSFDGKLRRFNPSNLKEYIRSIHAGLTTAIIDEEDSDNRLNDILITRLRTSYGLRPGDISDVDFQRIKSSVDMLCRRGMLEINGDSIRIPENRWLVSDNILRELIV